MKIYFAGSIRGGRADAHIYKEIITLLSKYGRVLTEHVGDTALPESGEIATSEQYIFERDAKWIHEADVLVAEVTVTSLGVGYEIGLADSLDKKILCLYRPQQGRLLSAMIVGNRRLRVEPYSDVSEIPSILKKFFNKN